MSSIYPCGSWASHLVMLPIPWREIAVLYLGVYLYT
jgi:hypothetical protein